VTGGSIVTDVTVLTEASEPLHPLTVEDYHRMIELGILTEEDKVELLDGALIAMSAEGSRHALVVSLLNRWLSRGLGDERQIVRAGSPMTLPPVSEPEPDLAVVELAETRKSHPQRAHLLIEVSLTSLPKDRDRKARIYAEAVIPQYWIIDLAHNAVVVHRDPAMGRYRQIHIAEPPAMLEPETCGLPPLDLEALFSDD
jgi:Uma2 family endonuclease